VKDDLDAQAVGLREEREKLGLFQGKLDVINSKRTQLISRAVEMYRLAAADAERSRKTAALLNEFPTDQNNNDKKRKP
jgi:vacuolar-type H+-ATPase subunit D/Vma8